MTDPLKFVLIGSGNIAKTYHQALSRIPSASLVGILSRHQNLPPGLSHLPVFNRLEDIEVAYDAVIIATPNGLHHLSTIAAARLGKHVLCEKPLDISLENIDRMIQACRENQVKLGVMYQRRYSSDNPLVKQWLDEQCLGRLFSVDLAVKNYRDDAYYHSAPYRGTWTVDGGGPFMQQASHYIDLYSWFFGRPTRLVSKLGTFIHDIEVEDHGAVLCWHDYGLIGTITASTATKPGFPAKLEIYSERGYLILENDVITHCAINGLDYNPINAARHNQHTGASNALVQDTTNHEFIITDFVSAIRTGREPLITGESAKNATAMILDIYRQQI